MSDTDIRVLEHRVDALESTMQGALGEIRDGIKEIAHNTGKLALLEERHAETRDGLNRAFDAIKECEDQHDRHIEAYNERMRPIEAALPGLKELRRWVIAGILAIVGVVGTAVVTLVVSPAQPSVRIGVDR
jgi:predicted  nucleic acid-binding Zn-ribbon protein